MAINGIYVKIENITFAYRLVLVSYPCNPMVYLFKGIKRLPILGDKSQLYFKYQTGYIVGKLS